MISFISNSLTNYLCKSNVVEEEQKDIYIYGYEIMISNILGFVLTVVLGLLLNQFVAALVFYAVWVPLRQYTGGYHANSYLSCNLTFVCVVAAALILSNVLTASWAWYFTAILFVSHFIAVFLFAPLENENKPLTKEEKKKHRKVALAISAFWCLAATVLYVYFVQACVTICVTVLFVELLLLIGIFMKKTKEVSK